MPEQIEDQNPLTPERFHPAARPTATQAVSAPMPGSISCRKPRTTTPFPAPSVPAVQDSLPAELSAGQSPMPGWLHWLESTAVPSGHSVFDPAPQASTEEADQSRLPKGRLPEGRLPESDAALLHDARSMVTALDLYCDLLGEPGVLYPAFQHYAEELRLIAASSRRLLSQLDRSQLNPGQLNPDQLNPGQLNRDQLDRDSLHAAQPERVALAEAARLDEAAAGATGLGPRLIFSAPARRRFALREPIRSLADELMAMRNLLAALAGPAITLGLSLDGGYRGIRMASDDLTRLMVNLVRNAADAMPEGGHIQITLRELDGRLRLTVTDNGCGLPEGDCEAIFAPGYTTHLELAQEGGSEEAAHRGMGLAIVRSLVATAGGSIRAANRPSAPADAEEEASNGAIFEMEFPLAE